MNINNKKLKNSDYCSIFSNKDGQYAVYHSLTCDIVYGGELLNKLFAHFSDYNTYQELDKEDEKTKQLLTTLYQGGFLVANDKQDQKLLDSMQKQVKAKQFIKTLYLSITYKCNLRCKYCISNNDVALDGDKKLSFMDMDKDTAKQVVDYYLQHVVDEGDKEVVLYGGEPLVNYEVLKFMVEYIEEKESAKIKKNKDYKRSRFILCTNGTLINKEKAAYLKEHRIYQAVTFDGDQLAHDNVRVYANGQGTFEDVVKAYRNLQELDFPIGVTLTLGSHNVDKVADFVELFAKKLQPHTMATNIMIDYDDGGNPYVCEGNTLADNLIKAFEVARKHGMYLVKYVMDNRIKPFVEKQPRLKGCTGTGSRIMVLPDGSLSACMAYANNSSVKVKDNPKVEEFLPTGIKTYSPFLKQQCRYCPAISCCGGGCPKSAEVKHGTLFSLDDDYCIQSKRFLEWLIWDLYNFIDQKQLVKDGFVIPSDEERHKIYGKIEVRRSPLDFQYTPNAN